MKLITMNFNLTRSSLLYALFLWGFISLASSAPYEYSFDGRLQITSGGGGGRMTIGTNLADVANYSQGLPFVDGMKYADDWSTSDNPANNLSSQIPRDADGYPMSIPYNIPNVGPQTVRVLVLKGLPNKKPGGRYVLLYDGEGDFQFSNDVVRNSVQKTREGRYVLDVDAAGQEGIKIEMTRSLASNHVRNVRFFEERYESMNPIPIFRQEYLDKLRGYKVLRFMDWAKTNDMAVDTWVSRTTPNRFQGSVRGVAYEYMIKLANELDIDAWFCIPIRADDNHIQEMARLIHRDLDSGLRVYVEYGNEIWNGAFPGHLWTSNEGCQAGLNMIPPGDPENGDCSNAGVAGWAGHKFQARRSGKIFEIFQRELRGPRPLTKVIASQAAFEYRSGKIMEYVTNPLVNLTGVLSDVLAVAPYFGNNVANNIPLNEIPSISVDEILNRMDAAIDSETRGWISQSLRVANQYRVGLVAYEGGQHVVGVGEAYENNQILTDKLLAANRHSRMYDLYRKYLDAWNQLVPGGTFCHFTFMEGYGKFGSWGLYEHTYQQPDPPKARALNERLRQ